MMGQVVPDVVAQHARVATEADPTSPTILPGPHLQDVQVTNQILAEDDVPPPYGDTYGEIRDDGNNGTGSSAIVTEDGRVNIRINQLNRRLSQIFTPDPSKHIRDAQDGPPILSTSIHSVPHLNIVIQVVGSRGDVQPFVALGKVLKDVYGHRVRLATHPVFKDFVLESGLEFFSIGGDPARLMAFMVKNPSLRPGLHSLTDGDVGQRRRDVAEYIQGCWRSCYQSGDGIGNAHHGLPTNNTDSEPEPKHFVADCIIANPPSFAHIHCAEKLGIPLHIMFTMPYSPTQAFPHPLTNIQSSNADPHLTNYISYSMVELLSWQALGDIINRFRAKCLGLDPISTIRGPGMLHRLKIPHTYCWSPALIPKPNDWGSHISVSGFCFLDLTSDYTPNADLMAFLNNGPPPLYIGFGSIVLDDPDGMTKLIFEAIRKTGQRVLLSKGWGGIGADELHTPDGVFILGNVPHDWLFKHVSCVIHHGGAGTTAAGISAGRPSTIVPFFGDQPFWGSMIARAGAGPEPILHEQLTADKLAEAIKFCLRPETLERAQELASKIAAEEGCEAAAKSIHQFLKPDQLCCSLAPSRVGVWRVKRTKVRLSAFAACTLAHANLLDFQDLKLFRPQEHYTDEGPVDPISGGFTAFARATGGMMMGLARVPSETWKAVQIPAERSRLQSRTSLSKVTSQDEASSVGEGSISADRAGRTETSSTTKDFLTHAENHESVVDRPTSTSLTDQKSVYDSQKSQSSAQKEDSNLNQLRSRDTLGPSKDADMLRPIGVHMTQGAGRFVRALVQGPIDISVNLTRGVHNIPKLWGDDTVRPQERVSDFKSGIKAAGREFHFGFYDGITGLVTQPLNGVRKEGAGGFFKGVGKGIGGFLVKPGAAALGILSHTLQGVNKEVQSLFGSNVHSYIIASRVAQGYEEWLQSSDEEKQQVIAKWTLIQKNLKKSEPEEDARGNRESQQDVGHKDAKA